MKLIGRNHRRRHIAALAAGTFLSTVVALPGLADNGTVTETPIKHVVVIFFENESFDHYFGTYPHAQNPNNEPRFNARDDTPAVNNLLANDLLTNNPNLKQPYRLDRSEAFTCDMDHDYTDEQKAVNGGLMDKFVQATSSIGLGCRSDGSTVMAYYDGNTVTALWNYAQNFAMSDNSFGSMFGPSTVGAINLVSGQTANAVLATAFGGGKVTGSSPLSAITGDPDPALDDCGADAGGTKTGKGTVQMASGKNVGDLLNAKHVTWGWFQGGFAPTAPAVTNPDGSTKTAAVCGSAHLEHEYIPPGRTTPVLVVPNPTVQDGQTNPPTDIHTSTGDYVPHHEPFQYYASTRNQHHLRPSPDTPEEIGRSDQANHQYDTSDFFNALSHGNLPSVSYLKPPKYENAHPGNSDPLLEQVFLVQVVNALQKSPFWQDTAVIINYDDSDGWYDHVTGPIVNHSANNAGAGGDNATVNANDSFVPTLPLSTSTAAAAPKNIPTSGVCGPAPAGAPPGAGRCGYGPRLPLLVISPWAKQNFVDHTVLDQTSSLRFIEDNWHLGRIDGSNLPAGAQLGSFSFDQIAGPLNGMFDFDDRPSRNQVILDPLTGLQDNDRAEFPFGFGGGRF
ncbi:MAG: alkaline phosphatase family protein [Alphaproteobacteria bacterium]|nr:alkaline phosphatase family protein [Alphaproteobacteria bacterium]